MPRCTRFDGNNVLYTQNEFTLESNHRGPCKWTASNNLIRLSELEINFRPWQNRQMCVCVDLFLNPAIYTSSNQHLIETNKTQITQTRTSSFSISIRCQQGRENDVVFCLEALLLLLKLNVCVCVCVPVSKYHLHYYICPESNSSNPQKMCPLIWRSRIMSTITLEHELCAKNE